jgi:hypothetical protein
MIFKFHLFSYCFDDIILKISFDFVKLLYKIDTKLLGDLMQREDMYTSVLDYMCENYDYSLYATDFNARAVSAMQRHIASIPTPAGLNRISLIKIALHDFFNAIFQKVFIYEDEERLKIVKYFDDGASNESEDRQIHALRQELVKHKEDVQSTFEKDSIYMFDKNMRNRFELALISLNEIPIKELLRAQIEMVYDLDFRDIVIFLNGRIFVKKFLYHEAYELNQKIAIINDVRFTHSFVEELRIKLKNAFESTFDFTQKNKNNFYKEYPQKYFILVKNLVKNSFLDIEEEESISYTNLAFKKFLPIMLYESAVWLLHRVYESDLKATNFLKSYSESVTPHGDKIKINKLPLMDKKGKIHNLQSIFAILKKRELLNSKIGHKKIELRKLQERVKKSLDVVKRSEDEMEHLQSRRVELLKVIEKVEDEIASYTAKSTIRNIEIDRLEFSKRDLLEAFKQVEVRIKTQGNILKNTQIDLDKWQEKRQICDNAKKDREAEYAEIDKQYKEVCEILALTLGKEPIEL